jgi:hypothetical protein
MRDCLSCRPSPMCPFPSPLIAHLSTKCCGGAAWWVMPQPHTCWGSPESVPAAAVVAAPQAVHHAGTPYNRVDRQRRAMGCAVAADAASKVPSPSHDEGSMLRGYHPPPPFYWQLHFASQLSPQLTAGLPVWCGSCAWGWLEGSNPPLHCRHTLVGASSSTIAGTTWPCGAHRLWQVISTHWMLYCCSAVLT